MTRKFTIIGASLVVLFGAMGAVAARSAAPPDQRSLALWVGVWQSEGTALATPLGPAAKISGRQTGRLIANGLALEWVGEETGPFGAIKWGEVLAYDAAEKEFAFFGGQSDGMAWSGKGHQEPASWKWTGTLVSKGVSYRYRNETAFSADGNSVRWKNELSVDGKIWMPWSQGTMRKGK